MPTFIRTNATHSPVIQSFLGLCFDVMTLSDACTCLMCITGLWGSYVPGTASSKSRHINSFGETYWSSREVNWNHKYMHSTGLKNGSIHMFVYSYVDLHKTMIAFLTKTFKPYLRELLGDSSENQVVQIPGLCQIFDISWSLILSAPFLGFHQIATICLTEDNIITSSLTIGWRS